MLDTIKHNWKHFVLLIGEEKMMSAYTGDKDTPPDMALEDPEQFDEQKVISMLGDYLLKRN